MAVKSLGLLTLDLVAKINQYTEPMGKAERVTADASKKMTSNLNGVEKSIDSVGSASDRARKLVGSLVATAGIGFSVSSMITMADGYTQMAARIRNATKDAEEYNLVQDRLLETANTTFRALAEAQEVYLSLSGGMKSLGYATKDTLDLSDSLSFAFTANATRADQAQSAMDSLSKSMAKGKIDADAWISIVTGADNIIADMAKTTGMTEAQIRQLGAEGKASLEDLIKTLISTREANKQLADNMENSLADGFTNLSTAVTVYLGKANESTSATGIMAAGLGELAENIELVANVAMLGGVAYLTKQVIAQTIAVRGSIAESMRKRAAITLELQSQAQLAAVEVARTRQIASLAAQEVRMAQLALINAKNKDAQALATQRLVTAEIAYNIAVKNSTGAIAANTSAQNALNTSRKIGATLLGLVGGPIGAVTLGVTALAAGYMYMSSRTAEATAKLAEQARVADQTAESLKKLTGNDRKKAIEDATAAFEAQNNELRKSELAMGSALISIQNYAKGNVEITEISNQARLGAISYREAIERLNNLSIPTELYSELKKHAAQYDENSAKTSNTANALKAFGVEVTLAGNAAQNATIKHKSQADAINEVGSSADAATEALKKLFDQSNQNIITSTVTTRLAGLGYDDKLINIVNKYAQVEEAITKNLQGRSVFRDDIKRQIKEEYQAILLEDKTVAARNEKEKKRLETIKAQGNAMKVNAKVAENAAKYGYAKLEEKYNLLPGLLSATNMQESHGNANAIGPMTKYGTAKGGFQMLDDTAKRFGLVGKEVFDTGKSAEAAAKYFDFLYKKYGDWEKAISAYHAGEGNVDRGTNIGPENRKYVKNVKGYVAGQAGVEFTPDFTINDWEKQVDEILKAKQQLDDARKDFAAAYLPVDIKLYDKYLDNIEKATELFTGEELKRYTEMEKQRYTAAATLSNLQFEEQVDGWKWVGEEKIRKDAEINKAILDASTELSDAQKAIAKQSVDDQAAYKLQEFKRTQQEKIAQAAMAIADIRTGAQDYMLQQSDPRAYAWSMLERQQNSETSGLDKAYQGQVSSINELDDIQERNSQLLAAQQQYLQAKAELEEKYAAQSDALNISQMQTLMTNYSNAFGFVAGVMQGFGDDSSTAYKTAFALQKAFALSSAMLSAKTAVMSAWSDPANVTIYQKMAAAAMAAMQTEGLLSAIQGVMPQGFADGGYTGSGAKYTPKGIVHAGEVVWSQDDIKRWGGVGVVESMRTSSPSGYADGGLIAPERTLDFQSPDLTRYLNDRQQQSGTNVTVNTLPGTTADVTTASDGSLNINIIDDRIKQAFSRLSNQNSFESKQTKRAFNITPRRSGG